MLLVRAPSLRIQASRLARPLRVSRSESSAAVQNGTEGNSRPARFGYLKHLPQYRPFSGTARLHNAGAESEPDFKYAVIGGGVVGLAIARELAPRGPTVLIERHDAVGTETSSRNSEVIHAGIYYPPKSLKTELCIRGKDMLYEFCKTHDVPHRRVSKWIVAQNEEQHQALQRIHDLCVSELNVPVRWIPLEEAARLEPAVRARVAILESPTTGIIDSHALMMALLGQFEDRGGTLALASTVEDIKPVGTQPSPPGAEGWSLSVRDTKTGDVSAVSASAIINSAGLGAVAVHNMIVPPSQQKRMFYAKGNYFSYAASNPKVNRLIYPAPQPGLGGLGTHLTLDMAGRIRFGPDVEWVDSPDDLSVSPARLPQAIKEVKMYLPDLDETQLQPDYAGIRPKLAKAGAAAHGADFVDFSIGPVEGYEKWVDLLNIESPGLTSSLAISEKVGQILTERGW